MWNAFIISRPGQMGRITEEGGGHYEHGNVLFGSKQDEDLMRNVQEVYSNLKNDFSVLILRVGFPKFLFLKIFFSPQPLNPLRLICRYADRTARPRCIQTSRYRAVARIHNAAKLHPAGCPFMSA
jgi:hypothetical protein